MKKATLSAKLLCLRLSSSDLMISESAWDQSVSPSPVGGKGEENKPVRAFVQGHMSHSQGSEEVHSTILHYLGLDFYY